MGQMKVLNRRCIAQENYVGDWARKMIALLGGKFCFSKCLWYVHFIRCLLFARPVFADFCMDAEAEAADVERSILENVPLGDDANRDLLRAHIRVGKVGPFIGR